MYYAKALCKARNASFGEAQASVTPIQQVNIWQSKLAKVIGVLGGVIVLYETGKLIHVTHKHVKNVLR